jgi:hypothetical protein
VTDHRRLSQAISEGDGISVIAIVADAEAARRARAAGAEALAVERDVPGVRDATTLPVLALGAGLAETDAALLVFEHLDEELEARHGEILSRGLECVVDVRNDEELEEALDRIDPEIFLLSPREAEDDDEPVERVLELLPDVPAGKLAIAEVRDADRKTVVALERAGFDAVLVGVANVAELVGAEPPAV